MTPDVDDPSLDTVIDSPGTLLTTGAPEARRPERIARFPLPVDRRRSTDFLWQRVPFSLDGWRDGTENEPGIDLTLPSWLGRYHGVTR